MLYPVGFKPEDFSKPIVGIASSWSMVTPCNMHLDQLAREATVQRLHRGEPLWRAGERAVSFIIVAHGLVKIVLPSTGSRDLVMGLYGPGESVGDSTVLDLRADALELAERLDLLQPGIEVARVGAASDSPRFGLRALLPTAGRAHRDAHFHTGLRRALLPIG